jgi:hypothetical protein
VKRLAWVVAAAFVAVSCAGESTPGEGASPSTTVVACEPVPDAVCRGAALAGADLSGRSLIGIDLRNADLSGANLSDADLTQAVLIGANLSGANLDGAVFARATLDGAVLSAASVRGAVFSNASLRDVDFDGVETSLAVATNAVTDGATPTDVVDGLLDDDVTADGTGAAVADVSAEAIAVTPLLEELTFRISRDRVAPTKAARRYAHVALAMFAATNPDDPLLANVTGFTSPGPLPTDAHPVIASLVAGSIVARELFLVPADDVTIAEVADGLIARSIGSLTSTQLRSSFTYGRGVAAAVIARANADGFAESAKAKAPDVDTPGEWVPTSPNFQPAIDPGWGAVEPFVPSTRDCSLPGPARGGDPQSPFQSDADEVAEVAANLTDEQRAIARFWDDSRGRTGTPSGHWLVIALKLAESTGMSHDASLRMVAAATMAMSDTFVAVWREKYSWMVERPITVLQRDDASWSSYLVTPAFPEYPSGHSAVSRAAADVLSSFVGDVAFDDPGYGVTEQSRRQFNVSPRSFASLREAADEASVSRLYGGIHYVIGLEAGKALGTCVARAFEAAKP